MYGEVELQLAFANERPDFTFTLGNCPGPDGRIKYSEHEWGFGGNAGVMYAPRDGSRIGFTYTSKVDLDFGDRIWGLGAVLDGCLQPWGCKHPFGASPLRGSSQNAGAFCRTVARSRRTQPVKRKTPALHH